MAYNFSRRDQLSQLRGWRSYGHERAAKEEAKELRSFDPQVTARFMEVAKKYFTAPRIGRRQMRLWIDGAKALVALDHETADAIAIQIQVGPPPVPISIRVEPKRPESMFWYH